jgi:hypothetical protein
MHVRRLVGWWQVVAVVAVTPKAWAQSTASFPSDAPAAPAPAPAPATRPPAPPSARPAPTQPATRPASPPPVQAPATAVPVAPLPPAYPTYVPPASAASTDARPPVLPYYEGMPVPPGYDVVHKPASGLLTGGVVGLSISYGTAVIVGATQGFDNATGWLAVPLVGPWIAVAERDYEQCKTSTVQQARRCASKVVGEVQYITFVAVDGVFQIASALIILAGAVSARDELIRQDLVHVKVAPGQTGGVDWAVTLQGNL